MSKLASKGNGRQRSAALNASSALLQVAVNSILTFVLTRTILVRFGSDANGVNAVATQVVGLLLILEGGLTTATNVALLRPFSERHWSLILSILNETRRQFRRLAIVFVAVGALVCYAYSAIVDSSIRRELVFAILFFAVIPQGFAFWYATRFRVLFQMEQREYVLTLVMTCWLGVTQLFAIWCLNAGGPLIVVRLLPLLGSIAGSLTIGHMARRHFDLLRYHDKAPPYRLEGTRELLSLKIANALYGGMPLILVTLLPSAGVAVGSVYSVYLSVYTVVKSGVSSVASGARLGIGSALVERDPASVRSIFLQYQLLVSAVLSWLTSVATILVVPFVQIYTRGVTDIHYVDPLYALLFSAGCYLEVIHQPAGLTILMSGRFRAAKRIQWISVGVLVASLLLGGFLWGAHGVAAATVATAGVTALMELGYASKVVVPATGGQTLKVGFLGCSLVAAAIAIALLQPFVVNSYAELFVIALGVATATGAAVLLLYWLTCRTVVRDLVRRVARRKG